MEYEGPVNFRPERQPSPFVQMYEFFLTPDGHSLGMLLLFALSGLSIALIGHKAF